MNEITVAKQDEAGRVHLPFSWFGRVWFPKPDVVIVVADTPSGYELYQAITVAACLGKIAMPAPSDFLFDVLKEDYNLAHGHYPQLAVYAWDYSAHVDFFKGKYIARPRSVTVASFEQYQDWQNQVEIRLDRVANQYQERRGIYR
jgi:hypothetical protein